MLISIDNEAKRLGRAVTPEYLPFVVTIYRNKSSRSPVIVRRKTQKEARIFVEEYTGVYAHYWVRAQGDDTTIHSFTGTHDERYEDTAQYKRAELDSEVAK